MRAQGQRRDDAEAATASAAQCPEEVGVARLVAVAYLTVRRDDLCRDEIVAGETPGSREDAHATSEREPGDADRRAAARGNALAARRDGVIQVDEPRTSTHCHAIALHVDRGHAADVDDQTCASRPPGVAMAAAAQRERNAVSACEAHALPDVLCCGAARDRLRSNPVEARVVEDARGVVGGIARSDEAVPQGRAQRIPIRRLDGGRSP